jgi:hypothetical protein
MLLHVINPDLIQAGDQVTISGANGVSEIGTVVVKRGSRLTIEIGGDFLGLSLNSRRSPFEIVGHQPRLV